MLGISDVPSSYENNCDNFILVSTCWTSCSNVPSTPSPYPVARSSSQSTNISSVSTASSNKTVLAALNKANIFERKMKPNWATE